ncbi:MULTISPECIES: hypothetical protein [unclassified Cryobacterium]|uniref:hypothetical protein n=1 Tax=unclassified Cryobacterium TaxID=2649013 RepID=UPI001124DEE4|nr:MULTISPECIES: hypothetical protein [unclassified Cryobacterium]
MTDPRYRPRDYCAEPDSFGKAETVKWLPVTDRRPVGLIRAARLQHLYAVRIRARAKAIARNPRAVEVVPDASTPWALHPGAQSKGRPLELLAQHLGTSYPRLLRCLRGEIVMRLDDIAWADIVLGQISEVSRQAAAAQAAHGTWQRENVNGPTPTTRSYSS